MLVRRHRNAPDDARALAMFVGGFVVATAMAASLASAGAIAGPPAPAWPWIAGNAALAVVLLGGNFALQYGAARLPAAVTAIVMLSEVPFAALSSVALGGETLAGRTIVGGLLIVGATLLASLPAGAPARHAHPSGDRPA